MAKRQREVHHTALPLLQCINDGKFTRAEVAKKLGLDDVQNVTNWLARGIPARRISDVADLCELSTDDYRLQAGMASRKRRQSGKQGTFEAAGLIADFDALPDGLKEYVSRKVAELRAYADALPSFIRQSLKPPDDPEHYRTWEREIQGDMNGRKMKDGKTGK